MEIKVEGEHMKTQVSAAEDATTAIAGGTIIDGSGRDPIRNGLVVISGKFIDMVGPASEIQLPKDCQVIDATGKTVIPGMIDLHVHLIFGASDALFRAGPPLIEHPLMMIALKGFARARRTLEMGFTTLRDVGDVGFLGMILRNAIRSGIVEGPRIVACGQFLTATATHADWTLPWMVRTDLTPIVANGVDEILRAMRANFKMGADWIKFIATGGVMGNVWDEQTYTDDEVNALVSEAHRKSKPVCAHCIQAKGTLSCVKAGVDSIEHGLFLTEEITSLMVKKGTYLVPTLTAYDTILERGIERGTPKEMVKTFDAAYGAARLERNFRLALDSGVKIGCGTDAGVPAFHGENAKELELFVRFGMSPMQAIVTATSSSAAVLKLQDKLGTIEKGKLADLVVVAGDPLEDIRILQDKNRISLVMKEGAVCADRI